MTISTISPARVANLFSKRNIAICIANLASRLSRIDWEARFISDRYFALAQLLIKKSRIYIVFTLNKKDNVSHIYNEIYII